MFVVRKTEKDTKDPEGGWTAPVWLMSFAKGLNYFCAQLSGAFVFVDHKTATDVVGLLSRKGERWEVLPLADAMRALELALEEAEQEAATGIFLLPRDQL